MNKHKSLIYACLIALLLVTSNCSTGHDDEPKTRNADQHQANDSNHSSEARTPEEETATAEVPSMSAITIPPTGPAGPDDEPGLVRTTAVGSCTYLNREHADFYRSLDGADLPTARAILEGDLDSLLEALRVNPDEQPFHLTPLIFSASLGCTELMQALIDLGKDVNEATFYDTPLISAVGSGNISAVRLLLEYGADPNTAAEHLGGKPLSTAAYYNQIDTIAILLEAGANIHETANKGGESAIAAAGYTNSAAAAAALLDAGIQFEASDLKVAIWNHATDFFRVLVESGEIKQISESDRQHLAAAARAEGSNDIAELLDPGE